MDMGPKTLTYSYVGPLTHFEAEWSDSTFIFRVGQANKPGTMTFYADMNEIAISGLARIFEGWAKQIREKVEA